LYNRGREVGKNLLEDLKRVNYIQEIIEEIIKFSLIGIAVRYVIFWQMKITDKKSVSFKTDSKAVVRLPSILAWLGLIFIMLIISVIVGSFIFPEHYEKEPFLEVLFIFLPLFLFGLFSTLSGFLWKIQIDKDSDYFIYRTTFGLSYKIYYYEISYFKTWKHLLLIKYKRKFFFVSPDAINYDFFLQMLIKKNVKKKFKPFKPRTRL